MTYAFIALILFTALTALSVLGQSRFADNPGHLRMISLIDASAGILGAVIIPVTHIYIISRISLLTDDSLASWASDMFGGWYSVAVPAVGVLLIINILAAVFSLFDKKQQAKHSVYLRAAVISVSSAIPLILAPFYGFMTENDTLPLYTAILVSGIGMALIFRFIPIIERIPKLGKNGGK